jgi:hypothetical protein
MTKQRLRALKTITTWGGVIVTFSGIVLSVATGGSLASAGLSLLGVLITCGGHWIAGALARHQDADTAADRAKLADVSAALDTAREEMQNMSEFLDKAGVYDRPESLRRIIHEQDSIYGDIHQDDGR